ncbi:hypothetical protein B5F25_12835 [Bacteroides sp. An19]|nr:hypothetical protein B5F25_12835 [Bacteroides sp. An19]
MTFYKSLKECWNNQFKIPLKTEGYDPFIDFLKGVCIFFVVFAHCFSIDRLDDLVWPLWAVPTVPLFLIIQVFHAYKKGIENVSFSYKLKKLFNRILRPFLIILCIQIIIAYLKEPNWLLILKRIATEGGGLGPGSYYIYIYIQFFFLLPIFAFLFCRCKNISWQFVIFISLSMIIEFVCSYWHMKEYLYTLLFFRFTFLFLLGYLWVRKGVVINKITLMLSFISIIFLLFFTYTRNSLNLEPIFYKHTYWSFYHWVCYFYPAYLFVFILYKTYLYINKCFQSLFIKIGKCSYEILLCQMLVFSYLPLTEDLNFIGCRYITAILRIILAIILSIGPVFAYKKVIERVRNINS